MLLLASQPHLSPFNTSGATKGTVPQDCTHQQSWWPRIQCFPLAFYHFSLVYEANLLRLVRSSTTKASWNPVSFKETISSVCGRNWMNTVNHSHTHPSIWRIELPQSNIKNDLCNILSAINRNQWQYILNFPQCQCMNLRQTKLNLSYKTGQRLLFSIHFPFLHSPRANQSFRAWYLCGTSIHMELERDWTFSNSCNGDQYDKYAYIYIHM